MVSLRKSEILIKKVASMTKKGLRRKKIAGKLNISIETVGIARTAHKAGCLTIEKYDDECAKRRDFESFEHYHRIQRILKTLCDEDSPIRTIPIEQLRRLESGGKISFPREYFSQFNQRQSDLFMEQMQNLPKREKEFLEKILNGYTPKKMSNEYGISSQCASRIIQRAIYRIKRRIDFKKT